MNDAVTDAIFAVIAVRYAPALKTAPIRYRILLRADRSIPKKKAVLIVNTNCRLGARIFFRDVVTTPYRYCNPFLGDRISFGARPQVVCPATVQSIPDEIARFRTVSSQ